MLFQFLFRYEIDLFSNQMNIKNESNFFHCSYLQNNLNESYKTLFIDVFISKQVAENMLKLKNCASSIAIKW